LEAGLQKLSISIIDNKSSIKKFELRPVGSTEQSHRWHRFSQIILIDLRFLCSSVQSVAKN